MIIQLFNSSLVSGPETLVIPALSSLSNDLGEIQVWNLSEIRKREDAKNPLEYARSYGLKIGSIPVRNPVDVIAIKELALKIQNTQPSLVHAHDVKASIYLALARVYLRFTQPKKQPTFKIVSTHHGIVGRVGIKLRFYEWIYRFLFLRFFDATLSVCTMDREILLKSGLNPARVFLHLNGVDRPKMNLPEKLSASLAIRQDWESRFKINLTKKMVFGVAARLSAEKNHLLLLEALCILKMRKLHGTEWTCLCFGSGPDEVFLKRRTQEFGLQNHVFWAGYQKNFSEEMVGLDILISLSSGEGLPISLIEAGWSNTAIIATAVGGVNDLLPDSEKNLNISKISVNSTAQEVANRIEKLLLNTELRQRLAQNFQNRVIHSFSGSVWKKRLKEIYFEVLL